MVKQFAAFTVLSVWVCAFVGASVWAWCETLPAPGTAPFGSGLGVFAVRFASVVAGVVVAGAILVWAVTTIMAGNNRSA